jgi:hypothetical protein
MRGCQGYRSSLAVIGSFRESSLRLKLFRIDDRNQRLAHPRDVGLATLPKALRQILAQDWSASPRLNVFAYSRVGGDVVQVEMKALFLG